MKKHIAFFVAPYQGHVNPLLPVVADLVGRGHRITCVTASHFVEPLVAAGARTVGYPSVWPANRSVPAEVPAEEMAKGPLQILRENIAAATAAERELAADAPDLVVYDTLMNFGGRALAEKWGRPAAQFIPLLASNEHFSVLQEVANEFPPVDPQHPALLEFGARLGEFRAGHGLSAPGPGDFLAASEGLNLVCVGRDFQPAADTFDERYVFVGPSLPEPGDRAPWSPPEGGAPVLLVALGTLFTERPDFYRACAEAFADQSWHVVMAIGDHVDPAGLGPLPPHVEVHRRVPQLAVLEHARVFVTHGGIRSAMEALSAGTPMVAVAQSVELDFTARRIAELGLGVRIARREVTPEALRTAVRTAAEDPEIQRRVAAMSESVRAGGGAARAAHAIEAYAERV
ncbi:macrolide family glycosyltransferase [Streptomyces hygroscopicus]|uniref:macrolide family glycosyltransferase n=1 Tax=Streptomyces hygroscopicus TaxID=1912 RepID=UPI00068D6750|nr:macrolide family glycosyltransferase [Streptomyces hygroscopicus]